MKTTVVNISDAKAHLSEYAREVKKGHRYILCNRNKPFAEIRLLRTSAEGKRPFGRGSDRVHLPKDFNDPSPEIEAMFNG